MKKTIASLIIVCAALAAQAQEVPSTTRTNVVSTVKPLAVFMFKDENAKVIQAQLLAITNAAGKRVIGSVNPTNINQISISVTQSNGIPQRAAVVVR